MPNKALKSAKATPTYFRALPGALGGQPSDRRMNISNEQFVEIANPHSWFLVADNLHQQAVELRRRAGTAKLTLYDSRSGSFEGWDATNRSVFLLGGFALENALKAFLIYENPGWISNGVISKRLRSHKLAALAHESRLAPYKSKSKWILQGFEDGLESWARYPCSLSKDDASKEQALSDRLWKGYMWLIPAYGRRLRKLLGTTWNGPHGFSGHYRITGEFLGVQR